MEERREVELPPPTLYDWANDHGHIAYSIYPPMHVPKQLGRYFTADQMRAFGAECARMAREQERERCAKIAEEERPHPPGPHCPWSEEQDARYDALTNVINAIRKG